MKALIICNKGFEDESITEIQNIAKCNITKKKNGIIELEVENRLDLAKITYFSQSIYKVFEIISTGKNLEELSKNTDYKNNENILSQPIKVFVKFEEEEEIEPIQIIKEFMNHFEQDLIKNNIKLEVSMNKYKIPLYIIKEENEYLFGIDYSNKDLSKRDYRIFCHKNALNATVGTALLYFAGFDKLKNSEKTIILDPFCGSGTIPIEAGLKLNKISPHKFDFEKLGFSNFITEKIPEKTTENKIKIIGYDHMLPSIKSAQKNAKIANIHKEISLSKVAVDWLDTKFDEKTVDLILTNPPIYSNRNPDKLIEKAFKEVFYQAEFILKKTGKIIIIAPNKEILNYTEKFKLEYEKEVMQGKQKLFVLQFSKK
ncbi:methyltransferase [Candidatus Woesearchaeota archaeon]|nr:methyltransferase [Candidatus Woesearchaeota archaeon]